MPEQPISQEVFDNARHFTSDTITNITHITDGAINETYEVTTETGRIILQRMSPIFSTAVMSNLAAIQPYVIKAGVSVPEGLTTLDGRSFVNDGDGYWYRALNYIPGLTLHDNLSLAQAKSAAALVGRFHTAVADFPDRLEVTLPHFHDNKFYVAELEKAVAAETDEKKKVTLEPLAEEAIAKYREYREIVPILRKRVVHADLKISNVRFSKDGEAVALIDMDTMMEDTIATEMGDAIRSWAGVAGEDDTEQVFDTEIAKAALEAYRETATGISDEEIAAIPGGIGLMTVSLVMRFVTDAYNESYFALSSKYPNLYEQNLARAKNQLAQLADFEKKKHEL